MRPDCVGTESRFHDDGFKTLAKSRECNKALTSLNLYRKSRDLYVPYLYMLFVLGAAIRAISLGLYRSWLPSFVL